MDIYYHKKFKAEFENFEYCKKARGFKMAKKIFLRLEQLRAAPFLKTLTDHRIGHCHPLKGVRKGQFAMHLVHPRRLVFVPNHSHDIYIENSIINLLKITSVEIISIEDYH